jgi:hypothetical protein
MRWGRRLTTCQAPGRPQNHPVGYTAQDSRFTGKINWVQIALGSDDHDHFIDPEERVRIAMARQ